MVEDKLKFVADYTENGIEGIKRTGVKVLEMRERYVKMMMPLAGNLNHVGIMYAGSLFALGEAIGGALFGASFDYTKYYPLAKEITIRFRRPAITDVTLIAEITAETVKKINQELDEKEKADMVLDLELKDTTDEVVALMHGIWPVRKLTNNLAATVNRT